jgi:probable rRNA maturation factor
MTGLDQPSPLAGVAPERIDVVVASDLWEHQPSAEQAASRVIEAASALLHGDPAARGLLEVVLSHDAALAALNRQWRGIDKPTNVLSFPCPRWPAGFAGGQVPVPLGEIYIAYETVAREASAEEKPFMHHFAHLVAHGFLHLLGYDHDSEQAAATMENLEIEILGKFDIPDPYADRN